MTLTNSMFSFFKKLFSPQSRPTMPPLPEEEPPAVAKPVAFAYPKATTPPRVSAEAAPALSQALPQSSGTTVRLPLIEILARLPNELSQQVLERPQAIFSLPADLVINQLRTGAVRIPFSQLRAGAPPGTFADTDMLDEVLFEVPLPLVLAALGPRGLSRRNDQRQTIVPDEVTGVFDTKTSAFKRPVLVREPEIATPKPEPVNVPISAPFVPKSVTPTALAPAQVKPSTTISFSSNGKSGPLTPSATLPFAALPKSAATMPFVTKRTPTTIPAAPDSAPIPLPLLGNGALADENAISVTMDAISAGWPEKIQQQIQQFDLQHATLSIPIDRVEPGLKSGRIVFCWSEVVGWIKAPRPAFGEGETPVELPLRVVAPMYLKKRPPGPQRRTTIVSDSVPDVFANAHRQPPVQPAPLITPMPAAPLIGEEQPANVLGEIFNDMSKFDWSPQDIIDRTCTLHGVAGALLATRDGLPVAGKLPSPLKNETIAAFIPQIFSRVGGSVEAAQLGSLRALKITAGSSPCSVFKAGSLYLAIVSRNGQPVPETALERIADAASQLHE